MKKMIARCGLVCTDCGAYKATVNDNDDMRKQTAAEWSQMFGAAIDWKSINCLGCQEPETGTLFSHCRVCGIRKCAVGKGFATCAECDDFGCSMVEEIWKHGPDARKNLEELRG